MKYLNLQEVVDFLLDRPGYLKEGKRRLRKVLRRHGMSASLDVCARAIRTVNELKRSEGFKRLFFDIETSPNLGFFWKPGYNLTIGPDNIVQERAVICVSWKWEGENKVYNLRWDNGDDYQLLKEFTKVLNEADEAIAHNGDRFDIPWLRTRCLYHGLPFRTYLKSLDTLKKVRSSFNFNSNKLDYIAKFLGLGGKIETDYSLWKKVVLNNDKEALDYMVKYCDHDVVVLEDVYHRIKSYIKPETHAGVTIGKAKHSCPNCGSEHTELVKNVTTRTGGIQRLMECGSCGTDFKISNNVYMSKHEDK